MISISVGFIAAPLSMPGLVLSGLENGLADVGASISVELSDGSTMTSVVWGSTPGASDLGTGPSLVVPTLADGTPIFVRVQSGSGTFEASVVVAGMPPPPSTTVSAGTDEIVIESLAEAPAEPALTILPSQDTLIVEIA